MSGTTTIKRSGGPADRLDERDVPCEWTGADKAPHRRCRFRDLQHTRDWPDSTTDRRGECLLLKVKLACGPIQANARI
jgi:hypothetical protein